MSTRNPQGGAGANPTNKKCRTALLKASLAGHRDLGLFLIRHGAASAGPDRYGIVAGQ